MTVKASFWLVLSLICKVSTAFVASPHHVHLLGVSSHFHQHQQQQHYAPLSTTTTISLTTSSSSSSSLTSNGTDTSISTSSSLPSRAAAGRRAALFADASGSVARETVVGPWETKTTMTNRLSFLEQRKRLLLLDSSFAEKLQLPSIDPSTVEICDSEEVNRRLEQTGQGGGEQQLQQNQHLLDMGHSRRSDSSSSSTSSASGDNSNNNSVFPFALMMQQSARYIAQHWGKTVVFHIPGNLLEDTNNNNNNIAGSTCDKLLGDLAMAWTLGMKIVVVIGNRYDWDLCDLDASSVRCSNAIQVTSEETLRLLEEQAGYWRTEVERKLNKCLHHGVSHHIGNVLEGNVVSGNFYTAKRVVGRPGDYSEYTGYASKIHSETIHRILNDNHDVVVLSTVGLCKNGNLINVNGYHLAAKVAASLNAYKVVYMAHKGSVLQQKVPTSSSSSSSRRHRKQQQQHDTGDDSDSSSSQYRVIQELPISCAKAITDYHNVRVHKQGFASFEQAQHEVLQSPRDIELLLHMGWATWAVEHGVTRAHIVNPTDGALLEELFTSKNGANTCIFHDKELLYLEDDDDDDDEEIFWHDIDHDHAAQDDSVVTTLSSSQHGYGPILTSPTAFAAKKSHGSSNHKNLYSNNNNNKLGRNTAFLG